MNILETQWWSMALAPEWWADHEEDSVLVGDQDEVGCIEITTLRTDAESFEADTLQEMAQTAADTQWQAAAVGDFSGLSTRYEEEGAAIREWCVASGATALFITYSCDLENRGMDDAAVDELLDTLLCAPEA